MPDRDEHMMTRDDHARLLARASTQANNPAWRDVHDSISAENKELRAKIAVLGEHIALAYERRDAAERLLEESEQIRDELGDEITRLEMRTRTTTDRAGRIDALVKRHTAWLQELEDKFIKYSVYTDDRLNDVDDLVCRVQALEEAAGE